jgi:hypothetical protein
MRCKHDHDFKTCPQCFPKIQHRYSNLFTYFKCPKLFELTRIQGLDDGSAKNADLKFGTAVHLGIDSMFDGISGAEVFTAFWDACKDEGLEYSRLKHGDLSEIGVKLLSIFKEETMPKISPFKREERMQVSYDGIEIAGTPDCVGKFEEVPSIIDYKTSALPYDNYKIVCNEQMSLYADMAKKAWDYDALQGVYVVLIKDIRNPRIQIKKKTFDSNFVKMHIANTLTICQDIEYRAANGNWPKNSGACKSYNGVCPFFDRCFNGQ